MLVRIIGMILNLIIWSDQMKFRLAGSCVPASQSLSHVPLFAASWTVARQAPVCMAPSRQEYWSELPFPTPEALPNPGIETVSPASPSLAGRFLTTEPPGKAGRFIEIVK